MTTSGVVSGLSSAFSVFHGTTYASGCGWLLREPIELRGIVPPIPPPPPPPHVASRGRTGELRGMGVGARRVLRIHLRPGGNGGSALGRTQMFHVEHCMFDA